MSKPITPEEKALYAEVKADPRAFALLQAKCRWEARTLYGVLREWGDPRKWSSYAKKGPEADE